MIGLPRHIDRLTDDDLLAWVRDLIAGTVSESIRLDYKRQIELGTPGKNKEFAKDVSSFANSCGGVLVYGVTEEDITDAQDLGPVIVPRELVGLDPTPGICERMENVILSTITPRLPEFRIRRMVFQGDDEKDRFVIIIYVAESWTGAHMVTIGGENRYWTRHNFQSGPVLMDEHEVRQRYERNLRLFEAVDTYISGITGVLSLAPSRYIPLKDHGLLLILAAPILLTPDRVDASDLELRKWLDSPSNNPWNCPSIEPFFQPSLRGLLYGGAESIWPPLPRYEKTRIEIHANGLVEYAVGLQQEVKPPIICECVSKLVLFVAKFWDHLKYYGPVRLLFRIENANKPTFHILGTKRPGERTYIEPVLGFHFDISGADLIADPMQPVSQVLDHFYRVFGEERYPIEVVEKRYREMAATLKAFSSNQQQ